MPDDRDVEHIVDYLTSDDENKKVLDAILAVIVGVMSQELAQAVELVNTEVDIDILVANWSVSLARRVVGINQLTADTVAQIIAEGIKQGLDADTIVLQVESLFRTFGTRRALAIARTEVMGATNYTAFQVYTAAGTPFKRWIAIIDDRTRDSHASTHTQLVSMPEPFDVAGTPMMFPGDPSAPAREVVNCRCILFPEYAPDRSIWSVEKINRIAHSYDVRYLEGTSKLSQSMREVFNDQLKAVLRFL